MYTNVKFLRAYQTLSWRSSLSCQPYIGASQMLPFHSGPYRPNSMDKQK